MNYFQQHRIAWIREMLDIYGFINRDHIQRKFWVSQPQASKDLQAILKMYPDQITYNTSQKAYVKVSRTPLHNPRPIELSPHPRHSNIR